MKSIVFLIATLLFINNIMGQLVVSPKWAITYRQFEGKQISYYITSTEKISKPVFKSSVVEVNDCHNNALCQITVDIPDKVFIKSESVLFKEYSINSNGEISYQYKLFQGNKLCTINFVLSDESTLKYIAVSFIPDVRVKPAKVTSYLIEDFKE